MPYRKTQLGATARPLALAQNPDAPDLHFHDLRGTAATKFYIGSLSVRVIAEVMAWEEETVEKIIRRHVCRQAATKALIAQLNESRKRT